IKTSDTYMKFSWLTVNEKSMDKEHICIIKHEKNKGGVDQEILFPSLPYTTATATLDPRCICNLYTTNHDSLQQLQLTNTSAYYTYLLLLLISTLYFSIITCCLFRRTVCSSEKTF
uniref:Immunoglobulin C1-set domain-containing protein n=1 Tax=Catagonus wagneri TaxID=51154 RepID=A0A8C3W518_9CETA